MQLKTPIAFCIFNRPELTERVFREIAKAKPELLLVIGDGPRHDRPEEKQLVRRTREIIQQVDWSCDVITNYSDTNLGCKQRMASGLDWAFELSEELIILEDDCLPDPTFFSYCHQLLNRYRDQEKVMMISGDNFQPHPRTEDSYYFSRWPHIWGWASWRRAWNHFDVTMASWPKVKSLHQLRMAFGSDEEYEHWSAVFDRQYEGEIDTWDFPWAYACWRNGGLTVLPETNLISNLGFGDSATHTTDPSSRLANLETNGIKNLTHPMEVVPHDFADQYTWENVIAPPTSKKRSNPNWLSRFTRKKAS